jgi:uncharacterized membrane protein YqjE
VTEHDKHTAADDAAGLHSLFDNARALFENGKELAGAELAFQKARAGFVWSGAKGILALAALALSLVFFVLMALVVGLLLALGPVLGAWGALGAVVLGLLALIGLCVLGVVSRLRAMRAALFTPKQAIDGSTVTGDSA